MGELTNTSEFNSVLENSHLIGTINGTHWAGRIYEKKIEGNDFAFVGHQLVVVNKNSTLSTDVRELYNNGQYHKLCFLIKRLHQATQGFIDESVKKYL